ncbi:MAG: hypothetical protein ACLQMT_11730 [Candidatus Acidiferrales bacterium]
MSASGEVATARHGGPFVPQGKQARDSARSASALGRLLGRLFSFPVFLGVLLFAGAFFGTLAEGKKGGTLFGEGDTWWHIRAGEEMLDTYQVPHRDSYSWTAAGAEWIAYEWLGEVAMAAVYRAGELRGLKVFQLLLTGGMLVLLYAYAAMRCGNAKAAFVVCALAVPVAAVFCSLRPQVMGYIFFLVVLMILEQFRRGKSGALWFLPLLFVVWVNTHGTFVFGLLAIGVAWACGLRPFHRGGIENAVWTGGQRRRLELAALASMLGLCLTPYSTRLAAYPLDIGFLQPLNIASIQEWMPLPTERFLGLVVFGSLLALLLFQILQPFRCRPDDLILLAIAAILAILHIRFVPLFLIISVPLLSIPVARWLPRYDAGRDRYALNAGLIAALAAAMGCSVPAEWQLQRAFAASFPVAAIEYLRAHPDDGPLFNEYGWGGYLAWAHVPARGVFIDGRADIYERAGVLGDYLTITGLEPGAFGLLGKYGIRACLLQPDAPLSTALAESPEWERAYSDSVSVVYVRRVIPPGTNVSALANP